jgi:hypothetical protein
MGLDFVLAHPEHEYLATEQDKFEYFVGTLQLEKSALPTKRYAASGQVTERYFVEKYPIFLSQSHQPASPPVVSFCFVDEGAAGIDGFRTFLQQYARLLRHLREFHVVYVAASDRLFQAAAGTFARVFDQPPAAKELSSSDALATRMLEHFKARRLYETQQWTSFDRAGLIRFRDERQEFSGEKYEPLYEQWKRGEVAGSAAMKTVLNSERASSPHFHGTFSTYRLEQTYDFFGKLAAS